MCIWSPYKSCRKVLQRYDSTATPALTKLLCEYMYEDVFSREEYDLGTFTAIKHSIDTGNAKPIRQPARRTPLSFQAEEAKYLQKQLDVGVVVPSCSAWASPVVLLR